MTEAPIFIPGPPRLEARLARRPGVAGLVVAHPHPLYGGSLDNNVVATLAQAGGLAGWTTLRFNFRGVGLSQGRYDQGRGEAADLRAALDYLAGLGLTRLAVAGYSFGAWVAARVDPAGLDPAGALWVAPPLGMMPLTVGQVRLRPGLILAGGQDDFCPAGDLARLAKALGPGARVEVEPSADHFWGGHEGWLRERAAGYLAGLDPSG
jgi:alpha/beta superfamily hydrolase